MALSRFSRIVPLALFLAWLPAVGLAASTSVQDASLAFRQGNNAVALTKVNAFLTTNPKDAQGRFLKGLILTELNRHIEAIKLFTDLTEDYPELPEPYNNLAVLYAAQAQYDRAKNSLEMAIRTHPSYATAHENLGDIYAKMASQSYDKALQLDKSNTSALTKLAMIRELFSPARALDAGKSGKTGGKTAVAKADPVVPPSPDTVEQPLPGEPPVSGNVPEPPATVTPVIPPAPAAKAAIQDPKAAIEATLQAWAEAWSKRDVEAYLSFYGENFKVPGKRDRAAWEAERRDRLTRAGFIKVELEKIKIKPQGKQTRVSFSQLYASNILKTKGKKTLILEQQGDAWKIVEER
jgi:tetratricopeptide (TPR) repeat protein